MISEERRQLIATSVQDLRSDAEDACRFLGVNPGEAREAHARLEGAAATPPNTQEELGAERRDAALAQIDLALQNAMEAEQSVATGDNDGALFALLDGQKCMTAALGALMGIQMVRRLSSADRLRRPIDWGRLIVNLLMHRNRLGRRMSATELAKTAKCSNSRITRLRAGNTEPLHTLGERLIAIHLERVGTPPQLLPKGKDTPASIHQALN